MGEASELSVTRDPVCGMPIQPDTAAATLQRGSRTLYFCSTRCLRRYEEMEPAAGRGSPDNVEVG